MAVSVLPRFVGMMVLCMVGGVAEAQPTITNLGTAMWESETAGYGVSDDGTVVVGTGLSYQFVQYAFRWSVGTGMQDLGFLPGGWDAWAYAVSGDGSTLAGIGNGGFVGYHVTRWTTKDGLEDLGTLPGKQASVGYGVNDDGSMIVGYSGGAADVPTRAFRWMSGTGMEDLGTYKDWPNSGARGISRDGRVVVGTVSQKYPVIAQRAFRWVEDTGFEELSLLTGDIDSHSSGVSGDGLVTVGWSGNLSKPGYSAVRWTNEGIESLGPPPSQWSIANAVSGHGEVVVGGMKIGPDQRAFIWTKASGLMELDDYLMGLGVDVTGWELRSVYGISFDGKSLTGYGNYKSDGYRAFLVNGLPGVQPTCAPDCDASGMLNIDDFICFQTLYAIGDPAADCDGSGVLEIDDFICFQTAYAVGC